MFAFQNLIKLVSLSMFLANLGKIISIQVKSQKLYSFLNLQRDLNFYYFFNNPKFLPIFAIQNLIKLVSLSMFLSNLGKIISIQVKSQNLYSFEFTKDLNFYYFFNNPKFLPIFAFQNLIKLVSLSMFLSNLGKIISIQVKSQNLYSIEFSKGFKLLLFF